tara:strand:- start:190 stop:393 length:204 start_codon:yes stop_codon:yes gene_type:complete
MGNQNEDWIVKHEQRKMEQDALSTLYKKNKFIKEIKSGMGEMIKDEPNKPQKKLKWYHKLFKIFSNG